jgi:nucleoside-diphosphate-sugar epimerase
LRKAVLIGGKGKVGSYLIPMLVKNGFKVINISRGKTNPNTENPAWQDVEQCTLDRKDPEFPKKISALGADIIFDMICFTCTDMIKLIDAIRSSVSHYLVTGSVWIHGAGSCVPVTEDECREPLEEYGIQKSLMDYTISEEYAKHSFPGTIVHPGHIVCPRELPINPQGCYSLDAFKILKAGTPFYLPNFGMETVHHVHASDVAGVFMASLKTGGPAFGQGFHAVSPRAVTLRGYAKEVASWYGKEADLHFEPFEVWKNRVSPDDADKTLEHMMHNLNASMEKAKRLLNFEPRYTSYEAVRECIDSFGLL